MKPKPLSIITDFLADQLGNYSAFENYQIDVEGLEVSCKISECEIHSVTFCADYAGNGEIIIKTCGGDSFQTFEPSKPLEFWKQWLFSALDCMRKFVPKEAK